MKLTPAQADLLEALDLYWRAYDRGPSFEDACVLSGASNATVELTLEFLERVGFIEREGEWIFVTPCGRHRLRKLKRYPFDPNSVRPRPVRRNRTATRSGGGTIRPRMLNAAGTFEARP